MTDLLRCLNCDTGPFPLEKAQTDYDPVTQSFIELCPSCHVGHALTYHAEPVTGECDLCAGPYTLGADDHNPETGNHYECETGVTP